MRNILLQLLHPHLTTIAWHGASWHQKAVAASPSLPDKHRDKNTALVQLRTSEWKRRGQKHFLEQSLSSKQSCTWETRISNISFLRRFLGRGALCMAWEGERVLRHISVVSNRLGAAKRRVRDTLVLQWKIKAHEAENLGTRANIAA